LFVCLLFPFSFEYTRREYYAPWLDTESDSPRWIKLPQRRNVDAPQQNYEALSDNVESTRHFGPDTIYRITETLGALNTVGRYLVNMTRGDTSTQLSEDVPSAIYTISKNVLGRNVTDSIAPLVREALPVAIDDKNDEEEQEEEQNPRSCTTPEGLKG
jgi:hypothetical protein